MITPPQAPSGYLRQWERAMASGRPGAIVRVLLLPLASLRLTVALFAMTLFLVWVGTVAQQELSVWHVVTRYFHSVIAWVEFRHVFPRAFFGGAVSVLESLTPHGGFFFPGGITIGTALFVNLAAAHLVRFRLEARGRRLAAGLLAMFLAALWCVLMIQSGQSEGTLQDRPPVSWETLWWLLKAAFTLVALAAVAGAGYLVKRRWEQTGRWWRADTITASTAAVILASGVVTLWVTGATISQGSMRILYHLAQGITTGLAFLGASAILFGKRAGIVTLHVGVGLLMFGELLVSISAVEEQMTLEDGQRRNYAIDTRSVELVVIDRSHSDRDRVTAIPLTYKQTPTRWLRQKQIDDRALPFRIRVVRWLPNSAIEAAASGEDNPATRGTGLRLRAVPKNISAGVETDSGIDMASAYVQLEGRDGKDLGTYLLSQQLAFDGRLEAVPVGSEVYWLALRFRRTYKPYTLTLIDVRKDDYIGTDTPRNYSSTVRLVSEKYGFDQTLTIFMNNPVRFAGETFYQTGYQRDPKTGTELSTFQIVTNIGWLIPYVACGVVIVGMGAHFPVVFWRFLSRWRAPASRFYGWAFAIGAAVAGLLFGVFLRPAKDDPQGFQFERFGSLPVVAEGRVKPIDTVARAALRVLCGRESARTGPSAEAVPAVQWLLDVAAQKDVATDYRVFRIDNRELLHLLKLRPRPGNRFALSEFEPQMAIILEQTEKARQVDAKKRTAFQRKIVELWVKLNLYRSLQGAFSALVPPADLKQADPWKVAQAIAEAADRVVQMRDAKMVYAIPYDDPKRPWGPIVVSASRQWAQRVLRQFGVDSAEALAEKLVAGIRADEARMDELARTRTLALIEDILARQSPGKADRKALREVARERLEAMPDSMRKRIMQMNRSEIEQGLAGAFKDSLVRGMKTLLGAHADPRAERLAGAYLAAIDAYQKDDSDTFNAAVATIEDDFERHGGHELDLSRVRFEHYFHDVNPFFKALAVYLLALLAALVGYAPRFRALRSAALGMLVVTCLWHGAAIAGRVYISGRPPVTNLYSSALFVGWGVVVIALAMEAFYRLGVGNVVAALAALFGLWFAHLLAYEIPNQAGDTFTVMQAVLDTQFWLSTHVVCIALGYVATLLAGLLGAAAILWSLGRWLAGRAPEGRSEATGAGRALSGMIYFAVCLGIFFSFVGTVLGGLWGDDAWGRFWGWDPKENGALMIVLWNAVILHARWAGLIQRRGLALLATAGLAFLAWSWAGTNQLDFGLHAYGQTEGMIAKILLAWTLVAVTLGLGFATPRRAFR